MELVTLDEVKGRIDWTLDPGEERLALGALEDLSIDALHYTGASWAVPSDVPPLARSLILRACVRFLRNPEGVSQTRAGDETLMWDNRKNEQAGAPYFTEDEIAQLRSLGGGSGAQGLSFGTFGTYAWRAGEAPGDVDVFTEGGVDPFPWIAEEDQVYW